MDLQERLAGVRPADERHEADPFAEIKNRIHLGVIGDLGPQLFNTEMNPVALRSRVLAESRPISSSRAAWRTRTASGWSGRSPTTSSATVRSSGSWRTTP